MKKGFTLIELLAVIVVLAILMLVAGSNVFGLLANARKGSYKTEFLQLMQSAQTQAQLDIMGGKLTAKKNTECYTIEGLSGVFDNKGGYTGSVLITYDKGQLTITGWMSSNNFIVNGKTEKLTDADVEDIESSETATTNCNGQGTLIG